MKTIINLSAVAIILAIAALMVMGAYYGATYLWALFMQLEFVVRVVLSTGVMAALLSALIIAAGLRVAARLAIKGRLSEARHELYAHVVDLCRHYVSSSGGLSNGERDDVLTELNRVESDMLLLASGSALQAHYDLQKPIEHGVTDNDQLTSLLTQLIKSFRRDLGHAYTYEESKLDGLLTPDSEEQPHEGRSIYAGAGEATNQG